MSFAIAAAGTGGHVYPGLAIGEALVEGGVPRRDVVYLGGGRLEARVYPQAGFPFVRLEVRGLQRRATLRNLTLPLVVLRAATATRRALRGHGIRVVLCMGGYVTVPVGWAAHREELPLVVHEQNAEAGLANRVAARWATEVLVSFPETRGLPGGRLVGNPLRAEFAAFSRAALRPEARRRYRLEPDRVTVGVFGGSLGAGVINEAVAGVVSQWTGPPIQIVHLAGEAHAAALSEAAATARLPWRVVGFEAEMPVFYAACDLVIARAGGSVAEVTATATPAVLVPGGFGSGGHQQANAAALERAGAAVSLPESRIADLAEVVERLVAEPALRTGMAAAARRIAKPQAAADIAAALLSHHG